MLNDCYQISETTQNCQGGGSEKIYGSTCRNGEMSTKKVKNICEGVSQMTNEYSSFFREFNFNSKLVKVKLEDMREKPKKTRNWKGRRATERKIRMLKSELLRSYWFKNETGLTWEGSRSNQLFEPEDFSLNTHACSCHLTQNSSQETTNILEDFTYDDLINLDTSLEENLTGFLTSFDNLSDLEDHYRWSLDLQNFFAEIETQMEFSKHCSSEHANTGVSRKRANAERNQTHLNNWRVFRCFYYIYLKELSEAKYLKYQENEILNKINKISKTKAKSTNNL